MRQCDFNPIASNVNALHAKLEDRVQTLLEVAGHITASLFFEYLSQQYLYIAVTNSTVSTVNRVSGFQYRETKLVFIGTLQL